MRQLTLNIHMFDLISFDQKLAAALMARPAEYLPQVRAPGPRCRGHTTRPHAPAPANDVGVGKHPSGRGLSGA